MARKCHTESLVCYWARGIVNDTLRVLDGEPFIKSVPLRVRLSETTVTNIIRQLWTEDGGQDVAEYAVMLAVILVIVIGTVRLIGTNANNVFSQVGSQLGQ